MPNIHQMKTRSKINGDSDTDLESDDLESDDLESDDLEPDENTINESQLKRKRKDKINKPIKKSKSIPTLPDLLMDYIVKMANEDITIKNMSQKKNIIQINQEI